MNSNTDQRCKPFWIRLDSIGVKNESETIDPIYTEFALSIVYPYIIVNETVQKS